VFATHQLEAAALAAHVTASLTTAAFVCVFRHTRVELDALTGAHCVFLVADEGANEIVALHDALYTGPLASELRTDVPYIPHVTIARCPTADEAHRIAASVGDIAMRARIESVEVLVASDGALHNAARVSL